MKKFTVVLNQKVNDYKFGEKRIAVRKKIGEDFKEYKKTIYDSNTTDAYKGYHVFYDDNDNFEAIEIYNGEVYCNGVKIFPGTLDNAKKIITDLKEDDFGIISENYSVGISTCPDNDNEIDAILFGKINYYKL